jgi:3-methyl-2-oxobutanoate hydroxymethyltransferase
MRRKNKLNLIEVQNKKKRNEKLTWITAYDLPFAYVAEEAGIDMILVGDSGGMVQLGHRTTNPVTMDEMIIMAQSARRGAPSTFIVGDMPQGSYEISDSEAIRNALRFIKEAGCDAVKLEGGRRMAGRVRAIADAGILVVGHLGLTPQSAAAFGGYRVQGKTVDSLETTIDDSRALQDAGAFLLLLEAMPSISAEQITRHLSISVMGIGAGPDVDGQLVIMHDVLGFYQAFRPWFAKCYVPDVIKDFVGHLAQVEDLRKLGREERKDGLLTLAELAVTRYINEVREGIFPSPEYCYEISQQEVDSLKSSKYWKEKI